MLSLSSCLPLSICLFACLSVCLSQCKTPSYLASHPNPNSSPIPHHLLACLFLLLPPPRYTNGDLKFDPLGLAPKDKAGFKTMQTKELNNGRLAMLGAAGIVAGELITNSKTF